MTGRRDVHDTRLNDEAFGGHPRRPGGLQPGRCVFAGSVADVDGPGAGFFSHQLKEAGNVVRCDNVVTGVGSGLTNLPGGCTE